MSTMDNSVYTSLANVPYIPDNTGLNMNQAANFHNVLSGSSQVNILPHPMPYMYNAGPFNQSLNAVGYQSVNNIQHNPSYSTHISVPPVSNQVINSQALERSHFINTHASTNNFGLNQNGNVSSVLRVNVPVPLSNIQSLPVSPVLSNVQTNTNAAISEVRNNVILPASNAEITVNNIPSLSEERTRLNSLVPNFGTTFLPQTKCDVSNPSIISIAPLSDACLNLNACTSPNVNAIQPNSSQNVKLGSIVPCSNAGINFERKSNDSASDRSIVPPTDIGITKYPGNSFITAVKNPMQQSELIGYSKTQGYDQTNKYNQVHNHNQVNPHVQLNDPYNKFTDENSAVLSNNSNVKSKNCSNNTGTKLCISRPDTNSVVHLDENSGMFTVKDHKDKETDSVDENILNNSNSFPVNLSLDEEEDVSENVEKVPLGSNNVENGNDESENVGDNETNDNIIDLDSTVLLQDGCLPLIPSSIEERNLSKTLHLVERRTSLRKAKQKSKNKKHKKKVKIVFHKKSAPAVKKKPQKKKKGKKATVSIKKPKKGPPECHICLKTYSNHDIVKRHILTVHEKAYDKFCSVCNKGFVNMYALKVHSLSHSGIKPFQCGEPNCTNMYSTKQVLQFHYRFLHGYSEASMPKIEKKKDLFGKNTFVTSKSEKNCREYFNELGVKVKEESMDVEPAAELEAKNETETDCEAAENETETDQNLNISNDQSAKPVMRHSLGSVIKIDSSETSQNENQTNIDKKPAEEKKRGRKGKTPKKFLSPSQLDEITTVLKTEPVSEDEADLSYSFEEVATPEKRSRRGRKRKKVRTNKREFHTLQLCPKKRRPSELNVQYSWVTSDRLGPTKLPMTVPASTRELKEAFDDNCQVCYTCHIEDNCPLRYPQHIVPNDLDYPMGFFMPDPVLFGKSKAYKGKSSLFARDDIEAFTRFGPLLGRPINLEDLKTLHAADIDLEHFWPVNTDEDSQVNVTNYIDTKDVTQSNWLRFLLAAPFDENYDNFNMQRVMLNNEVYFITTRKVMAGEELLMRALEPPERLYFNLMAQRREITDGGVCFLCKKNGIEENEEENEDEESPKRAALLPVYENTLSFVRHYRLEHNVGHSGLNFATMYLCYVCNVEFNSKTECNKHKNSLHPEEVGKRPALYQCPICYEKVTCKPSVRYHRAKFHPRLHELGPQKCMKCDRVLESQAQLLSHLNKSHNPQDHRPVTCNVCQKVYKNTAVLKRHMDKTHDRKFYKFCDLCGKSFRDMYQLRVHSLTHSGLKPFICEIPMCTHAFTTKQWLQKHYRSAHGFTDDNMPLIKRKIGFDD